VAAGFLPLDFFPPPRFVEPPDFFPPLLPRLDFEPLDFLPRLLLPPDLPPLDFLPRLLLPPLDFLPRAAPPLAPDLPRADEPDDFDFLALFFAAVFEAPLGFAFFELDEAFFALALELPADFFRPPLDAPELFAPAARPTIPPITPPTTAPTGPATLPITAPVATPAVCFEIGGIWMLSEPEDPELEDELSFDCWFCSSAITCALLQQLVGV
jgi:hypothetical protein